MTSPGGSEVGRISIRVVPDTSKFRAELRAQLEGIEKSMKAKIPVLLELDTNGIREKVKAATAGLKSTAEVKLKPDIAIGDALAKWSALKAALAKDAKINIEVDVDKNRIQRTISSLFDKIPTTGGSGGGFGIPGSFLDNFVLVAAVAAIAAPAIALVSGALAALPAVLAGVAAPIGVIALGLDGIKKAAEVLKAPLDSLKASISGVFETRLTPVFGQLAQAMPKLEGPLKAVANGISDVAKSFVDTITTGPGLANIQGTISNIARAISDAAPGIGSLTNGLLGLANGVSSKFPAVSKWFNQAADAFSRWVDKATADGSLDRAMGNLGDTLKGVLNIVGDIAKQGFDWLQDPKFAKSMTDFVNNTKTLVSDVLPGLGGLFEQISSALNGFVPVLDKINNWKPPSWLHLNDKGQKQDNGFGAFPGMENPNVGKPPSWLDKIENGGFITETANSMQAMIATIEGQFAAMWVRIKTNAATALAGIGATIGTSLAGAWAGIEGAAAAAWNGVVATVTNVVTQIVGVIAQVPGRVASAWGAIPGIAAGIWGQVVSTIVSAGAQMLSAVVSAGAQIVGEVGSWGGKVASAAASIAHALDGIGGQMIAGFLAGFRSAAANAVVEVGGWAAKIAAAARSALGIHSPSKVFTEIGSQTAQGLQDGLEGGFLGVIERAKALSQQLTDAVNGGLTGVDQGTLSDGIKRQLDELELERKDLKLQKDAIPKGKETKDQRDSLQSQMDQITTLKDQLGLQSDQLGFSQKYGNSVDQNTESQKMLGDSLSKMIDAGSSFAQANVKQFESDLGIGGGALTSIADQGLSWLTSTLGHLASGAFGGGTTINVGSVDDAMRVQQNEANKKALQYTRR